VVNSIENAELKAKFTAILRESIPQGRFGSLASEGMSKIISVSSQVFAQISEFVLWLILQVCSPSRA
jgi:hypothetical protein